MSNQETSDYLPQDKFAVWYGELTRGRGFSVPTLRSWRQQGLGPPWFKVGKDPVYSISAARQYLRTLEAKGAR